MEFFSFVFKIVCALLIFGVIIMVHEFGHFVVAKWMKVRVNEFAIGMGPKIFSWGKGETVYSLRALPLGGFCAMEGEDEESPTPAAMGGNADRDLAPDKGGSFAEKPVWRRVLIVVAGATMNLILGFVVLLAAFGICEPKAEDGNAYFSSTTIAQLPETSPAYKTGLRVGDTILKIDGKTIATDMDMVMILQSDEDGVFEMTVRRDGEKQQLSGVTFELVQDAQSGERYLQYDFKVKGIRRTLGSTIVQAGKMEYSLTVMVWRSLGGILTGTYGLNDLSGPVGTVGFIGDAVSAAVSLAGLQSLLQLVAMITINVGVFNLLPVPALDGGRLLFLVFEGITRKKVPAKYESMVHFIGLLLLFGLMILVTFTDIRRLITG
jgi:regulator of sigma E protease